MRAITTSLVVLALAFAAWPVQGDPLPGENLVFQQKAMVQTDIVGQTFFGRDEVSTATNQLVPGPFQGFRGTFMSDDFAVRAGDPITHVRWWGSYLNNQFDGNAQQFFIAFERDIPVGPNVPFSRPATPPLLSQIVTLGALTSGSGTFTEKLVHPGGAPLNENLFEYNAELAAPFVPTPNTVYWLKVVALAQPTLVPPDPFEPQFRWGWHNRDYTIVDSLAPTAPAVVPGEIVQGSLPNRTPVWHFQDDAVTGTIDLLYEQTPGPSNFQVTQTEMAPRNYISPADGPEPIAEFSKDLAFELYAVPEPGTASLAAAGAVVLAFFLRYRRNK